MDRRKIIFFLVVFLFFTVKATSQDNNYYFNVQALGGYTTPGHVPFWLRSNQYGSIPLDGASVSFIGAARKDYDFKKGKLFDWGASFEGRANLGQGSNFILIEGYGKIRLGILEFRAGRSKEIMGICDTTLSSGSFSVSGNNLGIPEVEISVPEYFTIPWLGQLFAFKGNFSHGWMGNVAMRRWFDDGDTVQINTFLHQFSLYGRFGKPSWSIKFYGGFNHQVVWGNEDEYYTRDYELSPLSTYFYVFTGKRYTNGFIEETRIGNHIGSIDLGLEYEFRKTRLLIYRQNFYESGALSKLANIQDGLNGISITNTNDQDRAFFVHKLLFEYLYTKNQAGEPWSPEYGSPYEGYYNHGEYVQGWSYNSIGLGSPFLTPETDVREELPSAPEEYFVNNRVIALHVGCEGSLKEFNYVIRASWSKNYGTYYTTDQDQSTEIPNPGAYGIFGEQEETSAYLELNRGLNNGLNLGFIGAFDYGNLLYNSFGLFFKASYSFNL